VRERRVEWEHALERMREKGVGVCAGERDRERESGQAISGQAKPFEMVVASITGTVSKKWEVEMFKHRWPLSEDGLD
jgi:hypothetical protein